MQAIQTSYVALILGSLEIEAAFIMPQQLQSIGEESQGLALRLLTFIELFQNADYYAVDPHLVETENKKHFAKNNAFGETVSGDTLHNFSPKDDNKADCIRDEAIHMCKLREYSSFVCMMALSSVLDRRIFSCYPEDALPALVQYRHSSF